MSKAAVIGLVVGISILMPAAFMLMYQAPSLETLQLNMTLKLQSTSGSLEYRASYHFGANRIDSSVSTDNIEWTSRTAAASVETSDDLTTAIRSYFSEITIESDKFFVRSDGTWTLSLQEKLCEGVSVRIAAYGDNTTVTNIVPSLSVDYVPSALASALRSIGVDAVRVIVTISLDIAGTLVSQYIQNCLSIIMFYANLGNSIFDYLIGEIRAD